MIKISWIHTVGSIKQRSSHQEWRRCQETSGVTTRDIRAQNVWGKWKWPEPSCGGGSCCILYIYCACLRKWQKNPVLAKNNEFTSTGVTLWGLHKLGGKEQNSESIKVPMILIIVLRRIEWKKFYFATVWIDLTTHIVFIVLRSLGNMTVSFTYGHGTSQLPEIALMCAQLLQLIEVSRYGGKIQSFTQFFLPYHNIHPLRWKMLSSDLAADPKLIGSGSELQLQSFYLTQD